MWQYKLLYILLVWYHHTSGVASQWLCVSDSECGEVQGAVCREGVCGCNTGQQIGFAGEACVDLAIYHTSTCVEDHQCSRLFTMFECRRGNQTDRTGICHCQSGHHYFLGRCWPSSDYGTSCTRDEQCITVPRNPYSLKCDSVCVCADGYYERQMGECRKIGFAVGDGCVVDEDCQFPNGVCEISTRQCINHNASRIYDGSDASVSAVTVAPVTLTAVRSATHNTACNFSSPCSEPFECSAFGACVCPVGYYLSDDGNQCNAELGSRSTGEQCVGLLAEVRDGICTCPPNFFFEENMRDCTKVSLRITDSCVSNDNCLTFGVAAVCGEEGEWGLRRCECDTQQAVWDSARQMCRLFAGIGEQCEVDSDCLAGEFEIQCVNDTCACPEGLLAFEGLCLTTGLDLNDECQSTLECTETPNTVCSGGRCSCGEGYQQEDDFCAATIGGSCIEDSDCTILDTVCVNDTSSFTNQTCQCREGFVAYDDVCWQEAFGFNSTCNVTSQCVTAIGANSACVGERCMCTAGHHYRDDGCYPLTGLFETCTRTSECYLASVSHRTHCRNSICQCTFEFPYIEEFHTCGEGSSSHASENIVGSAFLIVAALLYLTVT